MRDSQGDALVDSTTNYAQARTAEWANTIPQAGTVPATSSMPTGMVGMDLKFNQDPFWPAQYPTYPLNMSSAENMAFAMQMQNIIMSSAQVSSSSVSPAPKKKKPTPVPEAQKDETYRERRMRNNDSAKKSREARRKKEEEALSGLQILTRENQKLHMELNWYKMQLADIQHRLATGQSLNMVAPAPGFMQ
ncbi:hypothetical protein PRIPAC_80208 [Pristionchus pacificus]|uniref:BZIP domain-containing protein n=1 Tax=Pristionchus pacificus TaxID=54126 RepID=A0A454Y5E7_PRIPA|nr:hypothetical protein PRIPAC_80208 [Pristionchus pacificus]|eukprot:PDM65483.1 hypothetical protein PRIPAC_52425 [Pristionchus pacificus]